MMGLIDQSSFQILTIMLNFPNDFNYIAHLSIFACMIIFITGNSRSGTTMMSRILGNHDQVQTFQELHFFDEQLPPLNPGHILKKEAAAALFARLCNIQRDGYFGKRNIKPYLEEAREVLKNYQEISAIDTYREYIKHETNRSGKTIPCKQTPQYIFYLEEILKRLPDAKALVMIRDPREVLLSQKNKWKRRQLTNNKFPLMESIRSRINYHPSVISRLWNNTMLEGLKYENDPRVFFVHYEKLINDPGKIINSVCAHFEIRFDPSLLDIPVVGSSNFFDSNSKKGIDSDKTGQWNKGGLNTTEIYICQRNTSELMDKLGYEKISVKPNLFLLLWYKTSLPFRLILALFFNLHRAKDPIKLIKKHLRK